MFPGWVSTWGSSYEQRFRLFKVVDKLHNGGKLRLKNSRRRKKMVTVTVTIGNPSSRWHVAITLLNFERLNFDKFDRLNIDSSSPSLICVLLVLMRPRNGSPRARPQQRSSSVPQHRPWVIANHPWAMLTRLLYYYWPWIHTIGPLAFVANILRSAL